MVNTRLAFLFDKYLNNRLTKSEIMELQDLLGQTDDYPELRMLIEAEFQRDDDSDLPIFTAEGWLDELELKVSNRILKRSRIPRIRSASFRWMSVAAVLLVFIVIGALYWTREKKTSNQNIAQTHEIHPGGNRATLTLGDGSIINLKENKQGIVMSDKWIYSDGTAVVGDKDNETNIQSLVLSVPKGGTYQVTLPDGSQVWLNSASKLIYPTSFDKNIRKVELLGEAYFEVAKDKSKPFIVVTKEQTVEVLGTHFNISNYPDDEFVKTTLLEGSVRVNAKSTGNSLLLKPGEQVNISESSTQINQNVDLEEAVAWKNGYFKFNENLESILTKIARWYDVDIVYQTKISSDIVFAAEISRSKNLTDVLNIIEAAGNVHFKIEGRRVIVMK